MKALLIIDMQKGSFLPATPRYDTHGVIARINQLSAACRDAGFPVIYIQHDGSLQNVFRPHTFDWEILDELNIMEQDLILPKIANNAFYRTDLESTLQARGVEELLITGCATDFCVEATIYAALCKDYKLKIITDGHTTADRPGLTAKQVINHYNWVWSDLTPTLGTIELITTADWLSQQPSSSPN